MTTRSFAVCVVLLWLAVSGPARLGACTCKASDPSPCTAAGQVDAVFVAEVIESIPVDRGPDVSLSIRFETRNRMRVSEVFRGDVGVEVDVYTTGGGRGLLADGQTKVEVSSSCAFGFQDGVPYVVYANRADDGTLSTGMCMHTHRVASDTGDLAYFRAAAQGMVPSEGSMIVGRALVARVGVPIAGVQVIVESNGQRYETRADSDGYHTLSVPRGSYRVRYAVGDGLYASDARVEVVRDGSCVAASVNVVPDGRLTGRVVDSGGSPVGNISVFAAIIKSGAVVSATEHHAVTDGDGVYRMTRLLPGQYLLGIGVGSYDLGDTVRVFHPGLVDRARATTFFLELGENEVVSDVVVPADIQLLTVSGVVRNSSGSPVSGATVTLMGTYRASDTTAPRTREAAQPVATDSDGRFVISTVAGRYSLTASSGVKERGRVVRSQPFDGAGPIETDLTLPD
jgi:hypothetical protein